MCIRARCCSISELSGGMCSLEVQDLKQRWSYSGRVRVTETRISVFSQEWDGRTVGQLGLEILPLFQTDRNTLVYIRRYDYTCIRYKENKKCEQPFLSSDPLYSIGAHGILL